MSTTGGGLPMGGGMTTTGGMSMGGCSTLSCLTNGIVTAIYSSIASGSPWVIPSCEGILKEVPSGARHTSVPW